MNEQRTNERMQNLIIDTSTITVSIAAVLITEHCMYIHLEDTFGNLDL